MVSPLAPPMALNVGVLSPVKLSVADVPVSEAFNRSSPVGAVGAVPSIEIGSPEEGADVLPDGSVSVADVFHVPSLSVGSVQLLADPTV